MKWISSCFSLLPVFAVFACSGSNSDSSSALAKVFTSSPDTIRSTRDGGMYHFYGIYQPGGTVEYLTTKPYNSAGFVVDEDGVKVHFKVSKEYQEQMHKYPSIQVFDDDTRNSRVLFDKIFDCMDAKPAPKTCDCTDIKVL